MEIKNRSDVKAIDDVCRKIQELYHSENMSISYATIDGDAKSHKHLKTEEVCYIIKGKAKIRIGDEVFDIKEGDIIPIPKDTFHNIESIESTIELVVVSHPRFDPDDVIVGE